MAKRPKRQYGDILLELEALYDEMIDDHGVQWGDIFGHARSHLEIHRCDAREVCVKTGKNPKFTYEFEEE